MYKHPASAAVVGGVLVLQLAGASRVVLEQKKEIDRGGLQSISMYEMPSMPDGHHSTYGTTAIASWQLINHGAQVTTAIAPTFETLPGISSSTLPTTDIFSGVFGLTPPSV